MTSLAGPCLSGKTIADDGAGLKKGLLGGDESRSHQNSARLVSDAGFHHLLQTMSYRNTHASDERV